MTLYEDVTRFACSSNNNSCDQIIAENNKREYTSQVYHEFWLVFNQTFLKSVNRKRLSKRTHVILVSLMLRIANCQRYQTDQKWSFHTITLGVFIYYPFFLIAIRSRKVNLFGLSVASCLASRFKGSQVRIPAGTPCFRTSFPLIERFNSHPR